MGQGLVFSADNRTRIKEDAESLQCVMLMLDLVRGRCNRFPLHRPSSFPQLLMYFTVFFSLWTSASLYLFSHILSLSLSLVSLFIFTPSSLRLSGGAKQSSSSQCRPVIPTGWTFGTSDSDSMPVNGESGAERWRASVPSRSSSQVIP